MEVQTDWSEIPDDATKDKIPDDIQTCMSGPVASQFLLMT